MAKTLKTTLEQTEAALKMVEAVMKDDDYRQITVRKDGKNVVVNILLAR